MRIIAGKLGGRSFDSPKSQRTHPMSDKARGALFNKLGELDGMTVLDAFGGSGALSFEAISRGAVSALVIEVDRTAHVAITRNIKTLGLQRQIKAVHANANGWSNNNPHELFDIVIAAPPYDNLQHDLVEKLTVHVVDDGLFILDWPGNQEVMKFMGFDLLEAKRYGDAQLAFYRKIS